MDLKIIHLKEIDSTNRYCYKLGREGKRNVVVIADMQSAGVGRLGRRWYSNYGGLYFSILLDLEDREGSIGKLNFIGSISVYETLTDYLPGDLKNSIGIKFPNDIIVSTPREKKICGILSEINWDHKFVVLGIGININNYIPEDLGDTAVSLRELNRRENNRFEIFSRFLNRFRDNLHLGDREILKKYERYSKTLGRYVKVITPREEIKGTAFKIDYGGIYLSTLEGIRYIPVGDCIHLR
ncbi:MAG TPA: biotin--[acetyl-CoA-carboxylase] ligase [Methanothermococcus okinawensis]|uniref:Biotin--[acetyl-CoA-carboxylase] ligase n=1 Tax=Methanothermococcus okinawensis TaxID=155863 RepID=A0A832ZCQ4_9EURY|nr:biotin--[acetyl-CoA-carboxylase] ligase [Methanococcaceae archaeon]HIP84713.1 biotin--[acetyl-CoA-carboxylase] ligase [Methanothermococcus okinawensis]HIP90875.1 biotin--[acetyl-CoA-carboxylase] ligase [Methanothermococcus okinawensis]